MAKVKVLIEVGSPARKTRSKSQGFSAFEAAAASETAAYDAAVPVLDAVAGLGVEFDGGAAPVPMFAATAGSRAGVASELAMFAAPSTNDDLAPSSMIVPAEVERSRLDELRQREDTRVWPNSEIALLDVDPLPAVAPVAGSPAALLDLAPSRAGTDCRPFRPAVTIEDVRTLLGVPRIWSDGFRGQNIAVGILDEGIDGSTYPVTGGFSLPGAQMPGDAAVTSHGSMCAADVLVAAPAARLFDYPFLGVPNSGGALGMFQAVLNQRRLDGTPHLTNNSWGFVAVPPQAEAPESEIWDLEHPLHRKVREVVTSGAACLFAAGNCGQDCPAQKCHPSSIGPGTSIHGPNSLTEVITVAAVNSRHERIGYSSQGPGMFAREKPDLASYSHLFGNFGPGRPAGGDASRFDNGTSAATPVAAGVAALLLSAFPALTPDGLRAALLDGLVNVVGQPWDRDYGRGIVNAAASYSRLLSKA